MNITVKLFASLAKHLPPEAKGNIVRIDVPDGTTPLDVVQRMQVPEKMAHLVVINGVYVAPEDRGRRALQEGRLRRREEPCGRGAPGRLRRRPAYWTPRYQPFGGGTPC